MHLYLGAHWSASCIGGLGLRREKKNETKKKVSWRGFRQGLADWLLSRELLSSKPLNFELGQLMTSLLDPPTVRMACEMGTLHLGEMESRHTTNMRTKQLRRVSHSAVSRTSSWSCTYTL